MSLPDACPSYEILERHAHGLAGESEGLDLATHLESCPKCSEMVRQLARPPGDAPPTRTLTGAAEAAALPPELPARVGPFILEHEISKGGMGRIVRVRDVDFDRRLAMKLLLKRHPDLEERLLREARITGLLQHPGIPPVHAMGRMQDGRPYFVMKLIQGRSLHSLLSERETPASDLTRLVGIFGQICQTVGYAHWRNVLHRDLKPANVMVGAFGEVQVMDWGLAKVLKAENVPQPTRLDVANTIFGLRRSVEDAEETVSGSVMGTWSYMAPEQARGEVEELDARADVFGLGAILCVILTGKPPYVGADVAGQAQRADLRDAHARLTACGADPELVDIARSALAPDRENRPATASKVADAVVAYQDLVRERLRQAELAKAEIQGRVDEEKKRLLAERQKRRTTVRLSAAVLVVLLIGILGTAAALLRAWKETERAESAESDAKSQTGIAVGAQQTATEKAKLAEDRRVEAEKQSGIAAALRQRAEWQAYAAQQDLAARALREGHVAFASATLEACRWDFRGWEYYQARRQIDSARLVFDFPGREVSALAMSDDGKRLACAAGDSFLVCDAVTGERLSSWLKVASVITRLDFAPQGNYLVCAGRDGKAHVWASENKIWTLSGHKDTISSVGFSRLGRHLATGDSSGLIIVWDVQAQKETRRYADHAGDVALLAFPGDFFALEAEGDYQGNLVSLGKDGKLIRREAGDGKTKMETVPTGFRTAAAYTGNLIATLVYAAGDNKGSQLVFRNLWGDVKAPAPAVFPHPIERLAIGGFLHMAAVAGEHVCLLDQSGKEMLKFWTDPEKSGSASGLACSADGEHVAVASTVTGSSTVRLWQVGATVRRASVRGNQIPVKDAHFSSKGEFVALGGAEPFPGRGELSIFALPDLMFIRDFDVTGAGPVHAVAVSPDARFVASGHFVGTIVLWEVDTGKRRRSFGAFGVKGPVAALAFSPSGSLLAAASDNAIRMYDPSSGATVTTLEGHTAAVRALAFSRDGKVLATAGDDAAIRLWDVDVGKELRMLKGHGAGVAGLAFSGDGRWLASGSLDATVRLWETAAGKELWLAREPGAAPTPKAPPTNPRKHAENEEANRRVLKVAFTQDDARVVSLANKTGGVMGRIRFWDSRTGELAGTLDGDGVGATLAFSPDGRYLLSGAGPIALWETGSARDFEPRILKGQISRIRAAAFAPDGAQIACGSDGNSVVLYESGSGQAQSSIPLDSPCKALAYHPRKKQLAYTDGEARVAIRDLDGGGPLRYLTHGAEVLALAYSPDGALLATGDKTKKARLWDVAAGKELATLEDHDGRVSCLCFADNGATLLTGSWDGTVRVWEVASRSLRARLKLNEEGVSSLALSRDGAYVCAGGLDGKAKVWRLRDTAETAAFQADPKAVTALIVLPGGDAVSADADGSLHFWSLPTGRSKRHVWSGGGVFSLAASADGSQLLAGGNNGVCRVWDLRGFDNSRHRYFP